MLKKLFEKREFCEICAGLSAIALVVSLVFAFPVSSVAAKGDFFMPFYSAQTISARNTLTDYEAEIFDAIVSSAPGNDPIYFDTLCGEEITAEVYDEISVDKIFWAIMRDCPHIFWVSGLSLHVSSLAEYEHPLMAQTEVKFPVSDPLDTDYNALVDVVNSLNFEADTRYELLRSIHDYLCENITYDETHESEDCVSNEVNDRAHGVLGALCDGEAACQGYAKAFKFLCDIYKIPCVTVCSEHHMWNGVLMDDGCWYYVDVFGDDIDDEISCRYFLVGNYTEDEEGDGNFFGETHVIFKDEATPDIPFSEYSYEPTEPTGFSLSESYCESDSNNHLILSVFDKENIVYFNGLAVKNPTATGDKFTANDGMEYTYVLLGDLNGDGECDVNDFSAVINRALTDCKVTPDDIEALAADIDRDGVIDVLDCAQIERAVSRSYTKFWGDA